jgi:uncharacterized protein YndB with AHSA1/START domain
MKALKIILIIVGILVAAMLIIPIFLPATAEVKAEIEIALEPMQIFSSVASFENREIWDPWVAQDATTKVKVDFKPGYVGSSYSWDGEKLGTGKMQVVSVKEESYIESSLWFGEVDLPSLVEWNFTPTDGGTHVVWSFSQETKYPVGRLGMIFGKIFLKQSFEIGLASLKGYLEALPWPESNLGPITIETQAAMLAMVADGAGTMETIGEQLGELYGLIYTEIEKQKLQVTGPAFVHYLDYDASTGHSSYQAGFQVTKKGKSSGNVVWVTYPKMKVVQAIHIGP